MGARCFVKGSPCCEQCARNRRETARLRAVIRAWLMHVPSSDSPNDTIVEIPLGELRGALRAKPPKVPR